MQNKNYSFKLSKFNIRKNSLNHLYFSHFA